MKNANEQYYINLTPWKRELNLDKVKRFNEIHYADVIILHFDFISSLFTTKEKPNKQIFVAAINICLRVYEIIKKLYPYNLVYVIIHTRKTAINHFTIDFDTFKSIIDLVPNFAIIAKEDNNSDLMYYNQSSYKHIFYNFLNTIIKNKFSNCECQFWKTISGKLIVR